MYMYAGVLQRHPTNQTNSWITGSIYLCHSEQDPECILKVKKVLPKHRWAINNTEHYSCCAIYLSLLSRNNDKEIQQQSLDRSIAAIKFEVATRAQTEAGFIHVEWDGSISKRSIPTRADSTLNTRQAAACELWSDRTLCHNGTERVRSSRARRAACVVTWRLQTEERRSHATARNRVVIYGNKYWFSAFFLPKHTRPL